MILTCKTEELKQTIKIQLEHFFPMQKAFCGNDVNQAFVTALERTEYCFEKCNYYLNENKECVFSPMHSDQYSQFLYFLSNSLWNISQNKALCDQIILLNKALNSIFYSYKTLLPNIFFFSHPVGTILGNAEYHDFLVVLQNVTINTGINSDGTLCPILGAGLFCGAGAKIIGNKRIGDRVSLGVNSVVYNEQIPDDTIVYTNKFGEKIIAQNKKRYCTSQFYFNVEIK